MAQRNPGPYRASGFQWRGSASHPHSPGRFSGTVSLLRWLKTLFVLLTGGQNLTGGFTATSNPLGTITGSNQTITPNPAGGNHAHATLNGSSLTGTLTFDIPANATSMVVEVTNGGSGNVGATLSTANYTKVDGAWANTNGNKYLFVILRSNTYKYLSIVALQ